MVWLGRCLREAEERPTWGYWTFLQLVQLSPSCNAAMLQRRGIGKALFDLNTNRLHNGTPALLLTQFQQMLRCRCPMYVTFAAVCSGQLCQVPNYALWCLSRGGVSCHAQLLKMRSYLVEIPRTPNPKQCSFPFGYPTYCSTEGKGRKVTSPHLAPLHRSPFAQNACHEAIRSERHSLSFARASRK